MRGLWDLWLLKTFNGIPAASASAALSSGMFLAKSRIESGF
jgi:hypothetical protein